MTDLFSYIVRDREVLQRPSIITDEKTYLYSDIIKNVESIVAFLKLHGVSQGVQVAVLLEDSPLLIFMFLAVGYLGGIFVGINSKQTVPENLKILVNSPVLVLITDKTKFSLFIKELECLIPHITVLESKDCLTYSIEVQKESYRKNSQNINSEYVIFSSGSSGTPKGLIHTHSDLNYIAKMCAFNWGITPDSILISGMHLLSAASLGCIVATALYSGAAFVIPKNRQCPCLIETIAKHQATFLLASPTSYIYLKNTNHSMSLLTLKNASIAGAPISEELIMELHRFFSFPIIPHYGLSEFFSIASYSDCYDGLTYKASEFADIKLLDSELNPVKVGQVGEIFCKSPTLFKNTWNGEKPQTMDGYFSTGDLGELKKDGLFTVNGRKNGVINRGGNLIVPEEIESILIKACIQSVVFGFPDKLYGEKTILVVEKKIDDEPLTESEIRSYLYSKLAKYKHPDSIYIVDKIPTTPTGKISRAFIKKEWERLNKDA